VKSVVYLMDNMDAMAQMGENEFSLACVDPPFGLGDKLTQGGTWATKYKKGDADWDKAPSKEYFDALFRSSKNQIIWGGNYFQLPSTRCFLIWDKVAKMDTMADCEYAWTSFDKNAKIFCHVRNTSETRIHICQKPVALYDWIFHNYAICQWCGSSGEVESNSIDCDVQTCKKCNGISASVLDTHLGSGSSRIAADKHNLPFMGVEKDSDYFRDHCKRFDRYTAQQTLF